ncbi:magnesium chelatase ATPase subunit D [Trichinella spiralis]|uniref:magnesium chelatase ATPase subunit D n=1 Tax=Trichinella spiralis TaxID=6334 RepID=UPI0001EFD98B|nr:magnesium chelatase ATPase subunit D [Trichinella spiralis]
MIVGERCAANEQWRCQCDDRRRRTIKTALYRRTEDESGHPEDEGVRRVTLHDATLTVSNDQSPYFQSSPLPLPVAVPEACRLARIPAMGSQASPTAPAPPPALLPVNGDFPLRSLLVPCWPETGFKEMTLSICVVMDVV